MFICVGFPHFSHVAQPQRRRARRAELLVCDAASDGAGHQGQPLPGARRVRRQPVRHQDGVHPRGGGSRADVHPRRQPTGQRQTEFDVEN